MKLITDWQSCNLIPENEKDKNLLKSLYESFSKEDKEEEVFDSKMINFDNKSGSLYIITYV